MKPPPLLEDHLDDWTRKRCGRRRRALPRKSILEYDTAPSVPPNQASF